VQFGRDVFPILRTAYKLLLTSGFQLQVVRGHFQSWYWWKHVEDPSCCKNA